MLGDIEVDISASYEEGFSQLRASPGIYRAAIIGWPGATDSFADEMLVSLQQSDFAEMPIMILSEDGDPAKLDWITNRPNTVLLAWKDQAEAGQVLSKLLLGTFQAQETDKGKKDETQSVQILLVDDSPTVRHNFRSLLVKEGYDVRVASGVGEAYELAQNKRFDIAVIDYFMPEENGDVLIRKLKNNRRTKYIEIAVLTGGYSDQVIRGCLNAGATECMFKNEANELFLARINSITRSVLVRRAIGQERNQLQQILSSVGEGVYGVDKHGVIKFVNPTAKKLLGYDSKRGLVGCSALQKLHPSNEDMRLSESECPLQKAYFEGVSLENYQTLFLRQGGETITVECTVKPLGNGETHLGSVIAFRDISSRLRYEADLRWQATHDSLTKLMNRETFEIHLSKELASVKNSGKHSALMFIDVDRFKYINDTAGHLAGDQILVEVGERLQSQMGDRDQLARISGDEFAVLLHEVDPNSEALIIYADRFRQVIECQKFYFGQTGYTTTITAGISVLDASTSDTSEAMSNADMACNTAKSKGRNCIQLFTAESRDNEISDELGWSTRIRDALIWNRFVVHYQPIVPLSQVPVHPENSQEMNNWLLWHDESPQRYEALVRLRDSTGKLVAPGSFLPLAERFEVIGKIDRWVIERTFEQLAENGSKTIEIYINLSVCTLLNGDLLPFILELKEKYGIDLGQIVFEITESSAVRNIITANQRIAELRETGLRFALDDFGSGFSSFYHLKNLEVDIIKIDGIFTRGLTENNVDRSVMLSINEVAHSMGKKTVLEHVDRPEVILALQGSSIDYLQGFYISEPLESLPPVLEKQGSALNKTPRLS